MVSCALVALLDCKVIKNFLKIVSLIVLAFMLLTAGLLFMLSDKRIQTYAAQVATVKLSRMLGSNVRIGSIEFEFISSLNIRDIYIEDQSHDTLAYIGLVDVELAPLKLLKHELVVDHIDIVGLYGNIVIDENGLGNYEFLADALPHGNFEMPSDGTAHIGQVNITRSRLRFRQLPCAGDSLCHALSACNIYFDDIETSVILNHLSGDSLAAQLVNMRLHEQSGLEVKRMRCDFNASRNSLVANLSAELPSSHIKLNDIRVNGYEALFDSTQTMNWGQVEFSVVNNDIHLSLSDLSFLKCGLKDNGSYLDGTFKLIGRVDSILLPSFNFTYNGRPLVSGSAYVGGLPDMNLLHGKADIDDATITKGDIEDLLASITMQPVNLGNELGRLGRIHFKGHGEGSTAGARMRGLVTTAQGSVNINAKVNRDSVNHWMIFDGTVSAHHFNLGRTVNVKELGDVSCDLTVNARYSRTEPLRAETKGRVALFELLGYQYHDLMLDGTFTKGVFDGKASIHDPNLDFDFAGLVDIKSRLPHFDFNLTLNRFHPYKLNMGEQYPDMALRTNVDIDMEGNSLDNLNGYIVIDSLTVVNRNKVFGSERLVITSQTGKEETLLKINSDIVNAKFEGRYLYSTLWPSLQKIVARNLPSLLSDARRTRLHKIKTDNDISFYVYVQSLDDLFDVLDVPLEMYRTAKFEGRLNDSEQRFDLTAAIPDLAVDGAELNDITLSFNNLNDRINFLAYLEQGDVKPVIWRSSMKAGNDSVDFSVAWDNNDSISHRGKINMGVGLSKEMGRPIVDLSIRPSDIIIADSTWHLRTNHIRLNADTTITVDGFLFNGMGQRLAIDGLAGWEKSDKLHVAMSEINLGYIMKFVPLKEITFGGIITGTADVYSAFREPVLDADIMLRKGEINGYGVGDIHARSDWDGDAMRLNMHGIVMNEAGDTTAFADGFVGIPRDTVDFVFRAQGLDVNFINTYTEPVTLSVGGQAYGQVHLAKAPKKKGAQLDGQAFVKNGMLGVNFLGTKYYFDDTVRMTPKSINFDSINIRDPEGHKGYVKGELTHDGAFRDFRYNLLLHVDTMMAMNTTSRDNDLYYGTAYGTGNVYINGDESRTDINVSARTERNTSFYLNVASAATATDNNFVTFVAKEEPIVIPTKRRRHTKEIENTDKLKSKLYLNLQLEATPDATVHVIIDPKTGDMLQGYGYGNMRIVYDDTDDIKLYGTYTLEAGQFGFTFQDVLRRDFKILRGSSMSWSGDPIDGELNVTATYSTTASLNDLDNTLAQSVTRTTIPVNCVLSLTDRLTQPSLHFDVELPNADESLRQQVRNIINTDEMKNRQVLYLLLLNKFYTPDYMRTSTMSISQNDAYSVLTNTVTGQINSWLSRLTKDFTLGFNVRQDGEGESGMQEYEAGFTYQPNNRLIINGNFGYRNGTMTTNKFVGDADIEYLLNPSGTIRAKAYTHTVDRYSLSTAQTKQGLGFVYKEEFDNGKEFFQNMKQGIKDIFKKRDKKKKKKNDK